MADTRELLAGIEAMRDRQRFMSLPLETRIRNTCPGCGCRLIDNDYTRALVFVTGPEKEGRAEVWVGGKKMKLSKEQREIRALRRKLKQVLPTAIDALDREADGLHVRDASADEGLQRAIRVLRNLHQTMDYRA